MQAVGEAYERLAIEAKVKEAIQADNEQDYAKALMLYKRGIEVLLTGVKYEKNETAKQMILKRVEGYMKRAEQLKAWVDKQEAAAKATTAASTADAIWNLPAAPTGKP